MRRTFGGPLVQRRNRKLSERAFVRLSLRNVTRAETRCAPLRVVAMRAVQGDVRSVRTFRPSTEKTTLRIE